MVVAGMTRGGGFDVEDREREVTQIGRGSFVAGRLQRPAIRATLDAISRMVKLARRRDVDRILCVATAAVREARNGGQFLQAAREACGITPRVIPAEEEGRLIFLAVRASVALGAEPSMVLDIGGGSMQMIVGDKDALRLVVSAPLGALRLQETHLRTDPPSRGDLQKLQRHIRTLAAEPLRSVLRFAPTRVYGSSGSIHALAQLAALEATGAPLAQLNGASLTLEALERLTRRLRKMSLAQRAMLRGLDARRAEIILPGAMVLMHVLEALGADRIVITDFGLREGLVTDYVTAHAREISNVGEVDDLRMRSVLDLLQRFQPEERHLRHARHVVSLALAMFDGCARSTGSATTCAGCSNTARCSTTWARWWATTAMRSIRTT
jgi:exopolyphosphatase/guanosine-5'-triphosphate,3'-diphosphate pyrophosphatase